MRPRDLGTNLLRSAILIYLACRARENEVNGAKKKTFETNILNFFWRGYLFQIFMALQIKIIQVSLSSTLRVVCNPGKLLTLAPQNPSEISTF